MRILKTKRAAFTLLELIVVIVILAILAALAIPTFGRVIKTSKLETAEVTAASLMRETLALAAFENAGITRGHVTEAASDLDASAASSGLFAAGKVSVVFGENEHSSSRDVISVALTQPEPSEKMGVAIWVEGAGCAVGGTEGTKTLTWNVLASDVMNPVNCKGSLGLTLPGDPGGDPDPEPELVAPAQPSSAPAIVKGDGEFTLAWEAVAESASAPLSGYRLYQGFGATEEDARTRAMNSNNFETLTKDTLSSTSSQDSGIGFYCYAVSAYGDGGESPRSAVSCEEVRVPTFAAVNFSRFTPSDNVAHDGFGKSVAVDGDTMVVGVRRADAGSGSAYVFTRNGSTWAETAVLEASNPVYREVYGTSVAIDGDTLLVGAPPSGPARGSVYVYTRDGSSWVERAILKSSSSDMMVNFGSSLDISGNNVIVGAFTETGNVYGSGVVYAFTGSGSTWSAPQRIVASDAGSSAAFGTSVAVDGDTAIIGAPNDTVNGVATGSAYVLTRNAGAWSVTGKLTAADGANGDKFGQVVTLENDTVLVSSFSKSTAAGSKAGAVYAFTRSGGSWSQTAKMVPNDSTASAYFGWGLSLSGDTAVMSALSSSAGPKAIYVFTRTEGSWTQLSRFTPAEIDSSPLGTAVAIDGSTIGVGAPDDSRAGAGIGALYILSPKG